MRLQPKYSKEQELYEASQKIYNAGSSEQLRSAYASWRKLVDSYRPTKLGSDEERQLRIQYFTYIVSEGGIAFFETAVKLGGKAGTKPYHGLVSYPLKE